MTLRMRQLLLLSTINVLWAPVNWAVQTATQVASPITIAAMRFSLFALLIWVAVAIRPAKEALGTTLPKGGDRWKCLLIGILLVGPAHAIYYTALQHASTSETTTINTSGPFWTTLFAIFLLGERVTRVRWLAIGMGAMGAYWVAMGFSAPSLVGDQKWNALYLIGTLLECLGFVLATRIIRRSSGFGVLSFEMLGVALVLVAAPFLMPGVLQFQLSGWTPGLTLALLYLVVIAGGICFGTWYIVAEKAPVSMMLVTLGLQAPVAALIGINVLGEKASTGLLAGTGLILSALLLGGWDAHQQEKAGHTEHGADYIPEPS